MLVEANGGRGLFEDVGPETGNSAGDGIAFLKKGLLLDGGLAD